MAFDGITIASIVREMKNQIEGGRIYKIAQPEKDELLLTIQEQWRAGQGNHVCRCIIAFVVSDAGK